MWWRWETEQNQKREKSEKRKINKSLRWNLSCVDSYGSCVFATNTLFCHFICIKSGDSKSAFDIWTHEWAYRKTYCINSKINIAQRSTAQLEREQHQSSQIKSGISTIRRAILSIAYLLLLTAGQRQKRRFSMIKFFIYFCWDKILFIASVWAMRIEYGFLSVSFSSVIVRVLACVSLGDAKGNTRRHKCDNKYHALYSSIDRCKQLNKNIFIIMEPFRAVHLFKTNLALAQLEYVCDRDRETDRVGLVWVEWQTNIKWNMTEFLSCVKWRFWPIGARWCGHRSKNERPQNQNGQRYLPSVPHTNRNT